MAGRFASTLEFFSIGQLISTLFSPFRQISAATGNDGSLPAVFRAFIDRLISRVIGSIIRFFTIIFGRITIMLQAVYELIIIVAWWFLPLLPVAGFVLLAIGWAPLWK
jgi:hypothetical protein